MRPEQIDLLISTGTPSLSPDGSRCVVATSRPSLTADAYVGQLIAVDLDAPAAADAGGRPAVRRITQGRHDSAPHHSPDGRLIAFLRSEGGPAQLAMMAADGGEPRIVTDRLLGVSDVAFAPDSRHVVIVSREPEAGRYGSLDGVGAAAEDPRRITGHKYQANGLGYTGDRPAQLFLLELPDLDAEPPVAPVGRAAAAATGPDTGDGRDTAGGAGRAGDGTDDADTVVVPALRQLTHGPVDHRAPVFSPDGEHVYFVAALHESHDTDLRSGVWVTDRDGADPRPVTGAAPDLAAVSACPTPDGRALFVLAADTGADGRDFVARNQAVYLVDLERPDAAPRRLTDPETLDPSGGDDRLVPVSGPAALVAGGRAGDQDAGQDGGVLVVANARGRGELVRVDATGVRTLHSGHDVVTGVAAAGGRVVVAVTDPRTAGDLAEVTGNTTGTGSDTGTGLRALTDLSAGLRAATDLRTPVELTVEAEDGYPVHGWVVTPAGPGPHPVLLNIHGGPYAQYGWNLFDEAQVYAAAGYAVVMCNPRGAAGYGQAHGRVIRQAMGTVDASDVLAFLAGALQENPSLDGQRLGVMGGSYGGFLTAWLIGHDHRFRAAIVERGFLDPDGFAGTSDIGSFFGHEYVGRDTARTREQSPLAVADRVRTPTLVLHSEQDLRCPLPQAQRYFEALLDAGVTAEMLLFPGENHELSRSGTPHHRRQRFDAILQWWGRWLPVDGSAAAR